MPRNIKARIHNITQNNTFGFEGDSFVEDAVIRAIKTCSPRLIVETGSFAGNTTRRLYLLLTTFNRARKWALFSAEMDKSHHAVAYRNLEDVTTTLIPRPGSSARIVRCNSGDAIRMAVSGRQADTALFYLDAHWGAPVIYSELTAIEQAVNRGEITNPIIFVHDWFEPSNKGALKFERMDGSPLDYNLIGTWIARIYSNGGFGYRHNTPETAAGQMCGCCVFYPASFSSMPIAWAWTKVTHDGSQTGDMEETASLLEDLVAKSASIRAPHGLQILPEGKDQGPTSDAAGEAVAS